MILRVRLSRGDQFRHNQEGPNDLPGLDPEYSISHSSQGSTRQCQNHRLKQFEMGKTLGDPRVARGQIRLFEQLRRNRAQNWDEQFPTRRNNNCRWFPRDFPACNERPGMNAGI